MASDMLGPRITTVEPGTDPRTTEASSPLLASVQEKEQEEPTEEGEEEFKNAVFLFLGTTYREEADLSFALTYERMLSRRVGLGVTMEATPSTREPVLLFPRVAWNATRDLWVILAPGLEFEDEAKLLFRTGLAWEFELSGPFGFSLTANYDFVADSEDAIVVGVEFGLSF